MVENFDEKFLKSSVKKKKKTSIITYRFLLRFDVDSPAEGDDLRIIYSMTHLEERRLLWATKLLFSCDKKMSWEKKEKER